MKYITLSLVSLLLIVTIHTKAQEPVYGITATNELVNFDRTTPGIVSAPLAVTGLGAGETLAAIDFRPATGGLYGLTSNAGNSAIRLYTINHLTGVATAVAAPISFPGAGGTFSMDFNPVIDRIRLVSTTGMNLRISPTTGTIIAVDTKMHYGTGDVNDGTLPFVAALAYTNNYPLATTTTLYDIDYNLDILAIQDPPNAGMLTTVGSLGADAMDGNVGLDISETNEAYASFSSSGVPSFFSVNLASGAVTMIGTIGTASIIDIAIAPPPCTSCPVACTQRQGFYGAANTQGCFNNTTISTGTSIMLSAFGLSTSQVFGNVANQRFFTLYKTDIENNNILTMLPGAGPAAVLGQDNILPYDGASYGDATTWYLVPIPTSGVQQGRIRNMLLAQTITLWFNIQTSTALGGIMLTEDTLVTAEQTDCGSGMSTGVFQKFGIPHEVILYLNGGNGYTADVNGLFALANDVLGGVVNSLPVSVVQQAVAVINAAFEECRILIGTLPYNAPIVQRGSNIPAGQPFTVVPSWEIIARPNPSSHSFTVMINGEKAAGAFFKLQVLDIMGRIVEEKKIAGQTALEIGANYKPGTYIIRVGGSSFKVVKTD